MVVNSGSSTNSGPSRKSCATPVVSGRLTPRFRHYEYNVTILLLVVSTTFVVLNVPYCACWFALSASVGIFGGSTMDVGCPEQQLIGRLHAAKYVASVPYYLNYAINFALYSLCARAFRVQLCRAVRTTICHSHYRSCRCCNCCCRRSRASSNGCGRIETIDAINCRQQQQQQLSRQRRMQIRRDLAAVGLRNLPYRDRPGMLNIEDDDDGVDVRLPPRGRTYSEPPVDRDRSRARMRQQQQVVQVECNPRGISPGVRAGGRGGGGGVSSGVYSSSSSHGETRAVTH